MCISNFLVIEMESKVWEITWMGRGGQGAVTASNALAKAAFLEGFSDVQAFPFFGAERRGAPVKAYTRISKEKIYDCSQIYKSDFLIILEPALLDLLPIKKNDVKNNGYVIINSAGRKITLSPESLKAYSVDATKIAMDMGLTLAGLPIVNTSMLGAFSKATGLVSLDSILIVIKDMWPEKFFEKNVAAIKLAYKECKLL